jgi:hypothetical protein
MKRVEVTVQQPDIFMAYFVEILPFLEETSKERVLIVYLFGKYPLFLLWQVSCFVTFKYTLILIYISDFIVEYIRQSNQKLNSPWNC